jgi:hypothetical protein
LTTRQTRPSPPTVLPLTLEEPAPLLLGDPLPLEASEQVQQPLVPLAKPLVLLPQGRNRDLQLGHVLPKNINISRRGGRLSLSRRPRWRLSAARQRGLHAVAWRPVRGVWQTGHSRSVRPAGAESGRPPGSAGASGSTGSVTGRGRGTRAGPGPVSRLPCGQATPGSRRGVCSTMPAPCCTVSRLEAAWPARTPSTAPTTPRGPTAGP